MPEREDCHIDLSTRFYEKGNTGIAFVGARSRAHKGCGIKPKLKRYIEKHLCVGSIYEDYARLYAICIYFLIKGDLDKIKRLVVCNDEEFTYVKEYLSTLIESDGNQIDFEIINITEYRNILGRNVKSLADNRARSYRKRALKPNRWHNGPTINVVSITYEMVHEKWVLIR